jgi:Ca-activated chloride channel family protein
MKRHVVLTIALMTFATACAATGSSHPSITAPSPGHCNAVDVDVSPDNATVIKALAASFNKSEQAKLPQGCAFVRTWVIDPPHAVQQLAAGWPAPQIDGPSPAMWIPSSSAWASLLNEQLQAAHRVPIATIGPSLASTRVVVAMPRPMAIAAHAPLTWTALGELAQRGWAAYGHPDWGSFQLGKANPTLSTDSLLATLAATPGSANADALERSVAYYGSSPSTFLTTMARLDGTRHELTYLSAVVIDERLLAAYNAGKPNQTPPVDRGKKAPKYPLVAATVPNASLVLDNPVVTLTSTEPNAGASAFAAFLRSAKARKAFRTAGYRTPVAPIRSSDVTTALQQWTATRKPARLLILFDVSNSMGDSAGAGAHNETKLTLAQRGLVRALAELGPTDEVGLREFSTKLGAGGKRDWLDLVGIGPLARNKAHLVAATRALEPRVGSPLYTATTRSFDTVLRGADAAHIDGIILLTDGYNEDEQHNDRKALLAHLAAYPHVRVFTIGLGTGADLSTLKLFAQATNADSYDASDPVNLQTAFATAVANF